MENLKIKIITGFRENQFYSVDADEAHKAYYLFLNPDKRGIFKNGVAIIGRNIQGIEPDYNGTMGWNPSWRLTDDDWNQIRGKGLDRKLRGLLEEAKKVAYNIGNNLQLMALPLSEAKQKLLVCPN